MSEAARPPALTTYLDLPAEESDPRALLGLPEGNIERTAVLNALRSRLAQVASHRLGASPEASEVRILLHAAAARMLMPMSPAPAPRTLLSLAPVESVTAELDLASRAEFERGAMLILGQHGGLSQEAMQALRVLALSHGVPAEQVVPEVMAMLGGTGVTQPTTPRMPQVRSHNPPSLRRAPYARPRAQAEKRSSHVTDVEPLHQEIVEPRVLTEQVDPGLVFLKRAGIALVVVITVLVVGAVGLYFMTSGRRATNSGAGPSAVGGPGPSGTSGGTLTSPGTASVPGEVVPRAGDSPGSAPTNTASSTPPVSLDSLIQRVRDAAVQLDAAPDAAIAQFEASESSLAQRWTEATPAQMGAMVDASMEFVYRASSGVDRAQRSITTLVSGVDLLSARPEWTAADVRRACFGAGMLARLLRERDLPSSISEDLHRRGRPTFGDSSAMDGSFQAGVVAASGRLPPLLLGVGAPGPVKTEAQAWDAYAQCALTVTTKDAALRQRILLGALERVVLSDRDPHQDASVLAAEQALARSVGFGTGSPARDRLVQWLGRSDVSNSDLHAITAAILEAGQNQELDITMVVSLNATDMDRADLRSRYESAWGVAGAAAPREYAAKWVARAQAELSNTTQGKGPIENLIQATRYATLNAAAMRLSDGDASTVDGLAIGNEVGVKFVPRQDNTWYTLTGSSDNTWAARYLAAGQDIPKRREILGQINQEPTPVDAAVLVMEATRGSPSQLRLDARRVVQRYTQAPTVTAAMLDFASFIPPTRDNSALIEAVLGEKMPTPRSPTWRVAVRRSLVRRMLEMVSSDESGFVDVSADHIRRQYEDSLASWNGAATTTTKAGAPQAARTSIAEYAASVRERLSADVKKIVVPPSGVPGVSEVLARLQERRARAEGDIQLFVAEQAACAELLAILAASEQAGRGDTISHVLEDFDQERRRASHVFEQVHTGERALCRLWIVRLGGEP